MLIHPTIETESLLPTRQFAVDLVEDCKIVAEDELSGIHRRVGPIRLEGNGTNAIVEDVVLHYAVLPGILVEGHALTMR